MALLEVARIARAHGLRGECVVELLSNHEERLAPGSQLVVGESPGGVDRGAPSRVIEIVASRPFQHRWIVAFDAVTTREAAEALHGAVLLAEPIVDPDLLFVHELIGAQLIDQHGVSHGTITAVQANPASDLLVIEDKYLVPTGFVIRSDAENVYVDIPEGLFDL